MRRLLASLGLCLAVGACAADTEPLRAADDAGPRTLDSGAPDRPGLDATTGDVPALDAAGDAEAGRADAAPADGDLPSLRRCATIGLPRLETVRLSPDGARVALAGANGEVVVLSSTTGARLYRVDAHVGRTYDVAYAPSGDVLYSTGADGVVQAFRASTGERLWSRRRRDPAAPPTRLDADALAVVVGGTRVELFDAVTGEPQRELSDPVLDGRVSVAPAIVALSPDGASVAAAFGQTVVLLDRRSGARLGTYSGDLGVVGNGAYPPEVQSVGFAPDGRALLVAVRRAYVTQPTTARYPVARLYAVPEGAPILTLTSSRSYAITAALSAEGTHVLVAGGQWWTVRDARGWITTPARPRTLRGVSEWVDAGARGRVVMSTASRLSVHEAEGPTPGVLLTRPVGDTNARTLRVSADGARILVSTADDQAAELWTLDAPDASGQRVASLALTTSAAGGIADLSDDGHTIAAASARGVSIVDADDGLARELVADVTPVRALSLAEDGRSLLIARGSARTTTPSSLWQLDLRGAVLARADSGGVIAHLTRTPGGWLSEAPSRDHFRGPAMVELWTAAPLGARLAVRLETWGPDSAVLTPDGTSVLAAPWLQPLLRVEVDTGAQHASGPSTRSTRLALSDDGFLFRAAEDGALHVSRADTPGSPLVTEPSPPSARLGYLRLELGGPTLAATTSTGETRVYCTR